MAEVAQFLNISLEQKKTELLHSKKPSPTMSHHFSGVCRLCHSSSILTRRTATCLWIIRHYHQSNPSQSNEPTIKTMQQPCRLMSHTASLPRTITWLVLLPCFHLIRCDGRCLRGAVHLILFMLMVSSRCRGPTREVSEHVAL